MNDIVTQDLAGSIFSLVPKTLQEAMEFSRIIADSDLVPKDYKGKPGNVLVAVQMGAEVGMPPMQAIQGIAVINGRPSIWGDALWALIKSHPACEWTQETFDDETMTAKCVVKRKGSDPVVRTFSKVDAEKARLWAKEGPWQQYPKRMLQMRARGFAARDAMPDALKGLRQAEVEQDIERDMGDAEVVRDEIHMPQAKAEPAPAPPRETVDKDTGEVKRTDPAPALIPAGPLRILTKRLADRELTAQFCEHFGIADPSELPMAKVNDAMQWVDKHAKD